VRTTLTLDDDIAKRLKQRSYQEKKPWKTLVNEILRLGLEERKRPVSHFAIKARDLGIKPGIDIDNVAELLEQIDGVEHK